jgi:hypothetical protein
MTTVSDQPHQPEPTDQRRLITSTFWTLLIFVLCLIARSSFAHPQRFIALFP